MFGTNNAVSIPIVADDKTGRAFKSARHNMRMLGNEGAKVSRALKMVGVGAGVGIAAGVALAGKAAATSAMHFETAAREVNSLLNLDDAGFKQLTKDIQSVSIALGTDLIDTTKAAYQAISAGVPKENLIDFLTTSSKAAIAGLSSAETAVDVLSTVVNSFGRDTITAGRAADILFAAVRDGKTTFGELASSMATAAPLAAEMGVDFEEVAAAAAALTKKGVPTAEAMTQIRSILVALKKPTTDMTALLNQLGFANGDAIIKTHGFKGSLDLLTGSAAENDIEITKVFTRVEALNGTLSLTGENAEAFGTSMTNAYQSAGAAALAFDENNDTAQRGIEKLGSAWKNFTAAAIRTDAWADSIAFLSEQLERLAVHMGGGPAPLTPAQNNVKEFEKLLETGWGDKEDKRIWEHQLRGQREIAGLVPEQPNPADFLSETPPLRLGGSAFSYSYSPDTAPSPAITDTAPSPANTTGGNSMEAAMVALNNGEISMDSFAASILSFVKKLETVEEQVANAR